MLAKMKAKQEEENGVPFEDEINELMEGLESGDNPLIDFFAKKNQEIFTEELGDCFNPDDEEELEEMDDDPEMEDYDMDYDEEEMEENKNSYFGSMSTMAFVAKGMSCRMDDLAELLTTSGKYEAALAQIEETGEKFADETFQPNGNSLCGYSIDWNRRSQMNDFTWARADEYFSSGEVTVYETLDASDITQGALGDCYFLAAVSAIAEKPERLRRLFLVTENTGNGLFAVALCLNGIWEEIILDDFAPVTQDNRLAFNSSGAEELWVVLLEKAWAKVHGGYLNIEAGLTREALRDLTGASAKTYFTKKDPEGLWVRLMEAEARNFVMTAGSDDLSGGSDAYIPKIGICGSHAYSLLAVYQLAEDGDSFVKVGAEDEYSVRLVKLRNPWGSGEWKGEWSDEDEKWTPELKEALGFTGVSEDGIFFMSWDQFLIYYSDVQICYYHDDYKYSAEKFTSERNETVFVKFTISEPGEYYFSANQKNRRFFGPTAGYKYTHLGWVLGMDDGEDCQFVGSGLKADKENWQAAHCEAGDYYAMVHTPWRSVSREFSYSVYGPGLADLVKVEESELPENFINKIFKSRAKTEIEEKGRDFAHRKHPGIKYVTAEHNGWAYVYFQNEEEEHQISVTLSFGNSYSGVRVMPPHSGGRPSIVVAPGEAEIVLYKNNGRRRTAVSMSTSFRRVAKVDNVKAKVKESQTILRKKLNGEEVAIRVHFYYHEAGVALLYVNETSDLTLNEDLEFNLDNAHIEGVEGNALHIALPPGKERLIKVVKDGEGGFMARLSRIMYTISSTGNMFTNNKWW